MKKKLTAIALIVALLAVAIVGGTLAYFTDTTEKATNTFTFGKVDIELTEPNWDEDAAKSAVPNQQIKKDPTVTVQDGSEDCWVRVDVTVKDTSIFNVAEGADLTQYFKGFELGKWVLAGTSANGDDLTYAYYYYTTMSKGDSATLFTSVVIPDLLPEYCNVDDLSFDIDVIAYAVQAEGFTTAAAAFAAAGL